MKSARGRGKSSSGNCGNKAANNWRRSADGRLARRITRMYDKRCRTKVNILSLRKRVNESVK